MAQAASMASQEVARRLTAPGGLPFAVSAIADGEGVKLPPIAGEQVVARNVSPELADKTLAVTYPAFYVYCERVQNALKEKFRTFSGIAAMCVDVRVSNDRLDRIEQDLQLYVDAVTAVLDQSRGTWSGGMFYGGGYEISFNPLKHGGKNFLQSAKVKFEVNISTE